MGAIIGDASYTIEHPGYGAQQRNCINDFDLAQSIVKIRVLTAAAATLCREL